MASVFFAVLLLLVMFLNWQFMLLAISYIVCVADKGTSETVSFWNCMCLVKEKIAEVSLLNLGVLIFVPLLSRQFFLREYGFTSEWPIEMKMEYAQNFPILLLFFTFPFAVIASYTFIRSALKITKNGK